MVLNNIIEVGLKGNKRIPYYREKGYEIPTKTDKYGRTVVDYSKKLYVKLEDMPEYSESKVTIKCEYQEEGCRDIYEKNVADYFKNSRNSVVKKDCCANRKCQAKKSQECNLINYGVENIIDIPNVLEKIEQTNLEKYGVKCVFESEYIKTKAKQAIMEKYGVENISQLEDIKIKKAETFYRNGSIATSRQQKYLHNLFGGELNYSNNTPSLDIAFPEYKMYIEVNCSGHDIPVKTGRMSQKEFDNKERRRYHLLKNNGWKGIFINSICDYLPSNEVLLNELTKAKEWFNSNEKGHSHYNINIGNKINDINYGKLRRITEKDLKEVS